MEQKFEAVLDILDTECHARSIDAGWWQGRQSDIPTKLALIHSEISEALEGYGKDLQDDHLPQFKMFDVELADALIRICDLRGFIWNTGAQRLEPTILIGALRKATEENVWMYSYNGVPDALCILHGFISVAYERTKLWQGQPGIQVKEVLGLAASMIFCIAQRQKIDLGGILVAKLEYNAKRADHKKEARESAGGKRF